MMKNLSSSDNRKTTWKIQVIPSISAEVQDPGEHSSVLQYDSSDYRRVPGQKSGGLARSALCRIVSLHASHNSRAFLNRSRHPLFTLQSCPTRVLSTSTHRCCTGQHRWFSSPASPQRSLRLTHRCYSSAPVLKPALTSASAGKALQSDRTARDAHHRSRFVSAFHGDSCTAYSQHSLRYDDHIDSQAGSGKRERIPVSSLSSASPQHNILESRAKVRANVNQTELTGIAEETTRVIRRHTISHKRSERITTNKEDFVENALLTETYNGTNAKVGLMPKLADIAAYIKEYCDAAGVHGVRYLTEDRRNLCEKIFWVFTLILCAVGCALMIAKVKSKLDLTPVVVTFAESETNIWHLPFPAVTICPQTNIQLSRFKFNNFAEKFQNNDDFIDDYLSYVVKIESEIEASDRLYYKLNDNLTWVKENFTERLYNDLYGDDMSEGLVILLDQMLRYKVSLSSREVIHGICNSTTFLQDLSPLEDNDLCESIRKYYTVWVFENKQKMLALGPFCPIIYGWHEETFKNSSYILDEIAPKFLEKVAPSTLPGLTNWNLKYISSEDAWKRTWTSEGRCWTFNMINSGQIYSENIRNAETFSNDSKTSNDWHTDKGYSAKAGPDTYPRRSFSGDEFTGLTINIFEDIADRDSLCNLGLTGGFKVILHRPEDYPQPLLNYYTNVPYNKYVDILIKPIVMITSPAVEKYDVARRQCYLSHEKHLKYFKFYTKNNCLLECLTNATLRKCGCVAFYMPRNASTAMCGAGSRGCMDDASEEMELRDMRKHLKEISQDNEDGTFNSHMTQTECDCLPSCLSIAYEADTSTFEMNSSKLLKMVTWHESDDYYDKSSYTFFRVKYKNKQYIASRRSELYGQIDFLANCGGLLGLFCGFSLISLIEFVYFLTIRLWSNAIRSWTTNRKINQNLGSA